jgi:hypothetical protein
MAKASTTKPKRTRASPEIQAEIATRLSNGESPEILAGDYGKSLITIRGYAAKAGDQSGSPKPSRSSTKAQPKADPDFAERLVTYAVATLEGKDVDQAEIDDLKATLEDRKSKVLIKSIMGG